MADPTAPDIGTVPNIGTAPDIGVVHDVGTASVGTASVDTASVGTALVTGAGRGLGREIAHALLARGWRVALLGRDPDALWETAAPSGADRDLTLVLPADVADPAAIDAAFATLTDRWRRLDLLVNNAGVFGPSAELEAVRLEDWQRVLDVNVTGAFRCAQHAMRIMGGQRPQGGRIVNIGSVSAHRPRPNSVAYAVSKHAVTGLTRAIALEGRDRLISCTQIDIGNAATAMTAPIAAGTGQADGSVRAEPTFAAEHVGSVVADIAALPAEVSVPGLTILATRMPYLGRG